MKFVLNFFLMVGLVAVGTSVGALIIIYVTFMLEAAIP